MKKIILFLTLIFALHGVFAQTGTITNIQVAQGVGENERVVTILFDLTGNAIVYDISLAVSFDNGVTFEPIAPAEVTGETNVAPGTGIQLIWDGRISYSAQSTDMARIKIIASSFVCGETISDIEGNNYNTVLISNQCWMKGNLNVGTRINSNTNQTNNGTIEKYCYNNLESNCDIYGGLYQWDEMMNYSTTPGAQGICPTGWHLPTDGEWTALETYVSNQAAWLCNSNSSYIAKALAAKTNWSANFNTCAVGNNIAANNTSGFSGLPGGNRNPNSLFNYLSYIGNWWSSTQIVATHAWYRDLNHTNSDVWRSYYPKGFGFSVRCLKVMPTYNLNLDVDPSGAGTISGAGQYTAGYAISVSATANPGWQFVDWTDENGIVSAAAGFTYIMPGQDITLTANFIEEIEFTCGTSTIADIDGNLYNTVLIGNQCWMKENLNVGTRINGTSNQANNGTIEKYCYNNLENNCDIYGGLYQWDEMMNYSTTPGEQGICPTGWHLPTDGEWTALETYVSSQAAWLCNSNSSYIAKALAATTNWSANSNTCAVGNNLAANNATGFSGLPGGNRNPNDLFNYLSYIGDWWSSTQIDATNAWYRDLNHTNSDVWRNYYPKGFGFSVRCLRD